jgi:hypothetical protein
LGPLLKEIRNRDIKGDPARSREIKGDQGRSTESRESREIKGEHTIAFR